MSDVSFPEQSRTIFCVDCGVRITTTSRVQKRCDACRAAKKRLSGRGRLRRKRALVRARGLGP